MEDKILDAARQHAGQAEVYSQNETISTVRFQASRCHSIETKSITGVGLRVIHNGRVGFSSTTDPEQSKELVKAAMETSAFGEPATFTLPSSQRLPLTRTFNNEVALEPVETMVAIGDQIVTRCEELIPGLKADLTFRKSVAQIRLANSRGFDENYGKTVFSLDFEGLLIIDSSLIWLHDFLNFSEHCAINIEELIEGLAQRAHHARRTAVLETKSYPCIFTHQAAVDLLLTLLPAINGKNYQKGISPLIGKENEKLFDEKLTIWDDGLKEVESLLDETEMLARKLGKIR